MTKVTKNQRDYLRSLVRMDIRKRERALDRFAAKPGQTDAEAAVIRDKLMRDLAMKRETLAALTVIEYERS